MPDKAKPIIAKLDEALDAGAEEYLITGSELAQLRGVVDETGNSVLTEEDGADPTYIGLKLIVQGDGITAAR